MITKRKGTITVTTRREFLSALKKQFSISKADNTHTIVYKTTANINLDSLCISGSDCHIVDSIYGIDSRTKTIKKSTITQVRSLHDSSFLYVLGKTVSPKNKFDSSVTLQCSSGIYGFLNVISAINYV